jgi:hypothetical protein
MDGEHEPVATVTPGAARYSRGRYLAVMIRAMMGCHLSISL